MDSKTPPGPDGIRRDALLKWDKKGERTANMFNAFLYSVQIPKCLKTSRTTLIPKTTVVDINQWHPLTIGSVILRAFSSIIMQRLIDACGTHERQRGFIESPGCAENLAILDGIMKLSKREKKPLCVVFIDFAKAFDTVSHLHIWEVLERRGVDEHIRGLIRNSYRGCRTTIRTETGVTKQIRLRKGVKQGDPMSPIHTYPHLIWQ